MHKPLHQNPLNVYLNREDVLPLDPRHCGEFPTYGSLDALEVLPAGSVRDLGYNVFGPTVFYRREA